MDSSERNELTLSLIRSMAAIASSERYFAADRIHAAKTAFAMLQSAPSAPCHGWAPMNGRPKRMALSD